jgi:hypothetical protein
MPLSAEVINGNLSCTHISSPGNAPGGNGSGSKLPML